MRFLACCIVAVAARIAVAAPAPAQPGSPPRWTRLPDDKYRCTRYAPQRYDGKGTLVVHAPPGKPMTFKMTAASTDRSKVSYRADRLPGDASVDARTGQFTWNIPRDATGKHAISLVAESAAGGKASHGFTIAIAEPDLIAAWRAGMGSFEPDCRRAIYGYDVRDVDGDNQRDLVWREVDETDRSGFSGTVQVRRGVAGKFDSVAREIEGQALEAIRTPDGKAAVAIHRSCCCTAELWIKRITPAGVDDLFEATAPTCPGGLELERDARGRVTRIVRRAPDEIDPAQLVETTYTWSGQGYE